MNYYERSSVSYDLRKFAESQARFQGDNAIEYIRKAIDADPSHGTSAPAYTAFAMRAAAKAWCWARVALDAQIIVEPFEDLLR